MIGLILTLALVGAIVWLVIAYVPMPQAFKTVIIAVAVILMILYVMRALGIVDIPLR